MKKNNSYDQIAAHTLLNERDVTKFGFLERKTTSALRPWIRNYVIISNGDVYIYKTDKSKKPRFYSPLHKYNQFLIFQNPTQQQLWMFGLKSLQEFAEILKFGSTSQIDMNEWIKEFQYGIHLSNSLLLTTSCLLIPKTVSSRSSERGSCTSSTWEPSIEDGSSCLSSRINVPSSISKQGSIHGPEQLDRRGRHSNEIVEPCVRNNVDGEYDIPDPEGDAYLNQEIEEAQIMYFNSVRNDRSLCEDPQQLTSSNMCATEFIEDTYDITVEKRVIKKGRLTFPLVSPINCTYRSSPLIKDSSIYDFQQNEENYAFHGTREEAVALMQPFKLLGSYLVRYSNERKILTVRSESNFIKYVLLVNLDTNRIYIFEQKMTFENIDQLLAYYHENYLPNNGTKLTVPYKLCKMSG